MELKDMLFWIGHASFYIKAEGKTVFVDPFNVSEAVRERADLVLITHAHFDHCSRKDIDRVSKAGTKVIAAPGCLDPKEYGGVTIAKPGFRERVEGIGIEAVPAYNVKRERLQSHPRANEWVGYVISIGNMRIYHAGDTDFIPEMKSLGDIDAALLPAGGTFTMDVSEAIEAAKAIAPRFFVPMHYKNLLGQDGSMAAEERMVKSVKGAMIMKEVQNPTYSFR
jgi:L-ascorbate metabolism protein UlaG (beta-lactamase superfamily)